MRAEKLPYFLFTFVLFCFVLSGLVRTDDALESNVKNKRLVQFAKENVDELTIKLPPGDNLGAGGLDRCLFSHLQKNWTRLLTKSSVGAFQGKRSVLIGFQCVIHFSSVIPLSVRIERKLCKN